MRLNALAVFLFAATANLALAQPAVQSSPQQAEQGGEHTEAFDRAYAVSFYTFDGCGDGLSGRIFRQALVERFNQCPFTTEAKQRFRQQSVAQRVKSGDVIEAMIEANGGMPVKLAGMTMTCHEQQASPDYQKLRTRLVRYLSALLKAQDIVPSSCDADTITP